MARKKTRELLKRGLISISPGMIGKKLGRPENLIFPTAQTLKYMKKLKFINQDVNNTKINIHDIDHQLLTNWVKISLRQIEKSTPQFNIIFLSSINSQHKNHFEIAGPNNNIIPDCVFAILDSNNGKSLLFFLEVDMGTETVCLQKVLDKLCLKIREGFRFQLSFPRCLSNH